jgi:hypothetical protein
MRTTPKVTKSNGRKLTKKSNHNAAQSCNVSKGQPTNIEKWITPFSVTRYATIGLNFVDQK